MEKEIIILNAQQHDDLCNEKTLIIGGDEMDIEIMEDRYVESRRHTELHYVVFKRKADNKFFKVFYETSVKDNMDWSDCNYGDKFECHEVIQKEVKTFTYE